MQTNLLKNIALFFAAVSVFLLPFYIQANSFFVILFGLSSVIAFYKEINFRNFKKINFLVPIIFYLILFLSALYSTDTANGLNSLGKKSFILILPILFSIVNQQKQNWIKPILTSFVLSTLIAFLTSLFYSIYQIFLGADINILTHANFTQIINLQSTYLALYMLVSIFILYFSLNYDLLFDRFFSKKTKISLLLVLILFTILIGTRILYVPLLLFIFYVFVKQIKHKLNIAVVTLFTLISICSIFYTVNKIPLLSNRISEFRGTDFSVLKLEKFEYDTPINGLTMRILFAKFGLEVLNENKTLFFGEGLGDAQDMLHCKFVEYNFYMGNPVNNDTGYLDYNYHNQYMQVLVQSGITGLVFFLLIFILALSRKNPLLNFIILSYLILFLVEAAIERQNGISHIFFFIFLLQNIELKQIKKIVK